MDGAAHTSGGVGGFLLNRWQPKKLGRLESISSGVPQANDSRVGPLSFEVMLPFCKSKLGFRIVQKIGNVRWQVNVPLSALYIVGIGLSGYSLFIGDNK